jgi:hypothetical protein
MKITVEEARKYLQQHEELLQEMLIHRGKTPTNGEEEITDEDTKLISRYQQLKTFELEKKMGLI